MYPTRQYFLRKQVLTLTKPTAISHLTSCSLPPSQQTQNFPPHTLLLEPFPRFKRDTTKQGHLGVVSGSGGVQLTSTVEENSCKGGLLINSETKSYLSSVSTSQMARIQAPLPLIETLTIEKIMVGVLLFNASLVLPGNATLALTASRAAAIYESARSDGHLEVSFREDEDAHFRSDHKNHPCQI